VAPHRLLPFPRSDDFAPDLAARLKGEGNNERELRDNDAKPYYAVAAAAAAGGARAPLLEAASCCFDPGDCTRRDQWVHFNDQKLKKVSPKRPHFFFF
jgi:hypothetical protein